MTGGSEGGGPCAYFPKNTDFISVISPIFNIGDITDIIGDITENKKYLCWVLTWNSVSARKNMNSTTLPKSINFETETNGDFLKGFAKITDIIGDI